MRTTSSIVLLIVNLTVGYSIVTASVQCQAGESDRQYA